MKWKLLKGFATNAFFPHYDDKTYYGLKTKNIILRVMQTIFCKFELYIGFIDPFQLNGFTLSALGTYCC